MKIECREKSDADLAERVATMLLAHLATTGDHAIAVKIAECLVPGLVRSATSTTTTGLLNII